MPYLTKKQVDEECFLFQKETNNELRKLEQDYINDKMVDMNDYIEKRKLEIVDELNDYAQKHQVPDKYNRDGEPVSYKVRVNPVLIKNQFLKPIVPLGSVEPMYNAEKLSLVFEYYMYVMAEINDICGNYPPSLTSFCNLASISLATLRLYRESSDLSMRIITEKIYDQIGDENLSMGQLGMVKERSTMFKLRSQNEITEAEKPHVNINISEKIDTKQIEDRINQYKHFVDKKRHK